MKYFLRIIIIITILEAGVYGYYNHMLNSNNAMATTAPAKAKEVKEVKKVKPNSYTQLANEKVKLISISENQKFVASVDQNNKLQITDLDSNQEVYSSTEKSDIVYLKFIRSDSLFIGIKTENKDLVLKTIQIGANRERTIKTFTDVSPTSTFKSITYSPFTNDVYILIGNDVNTKMYHFDTNGQMTALPSQFSYIENPMMLASKNVLFFEDKHNNIWMSQDNKSLKKIAENATLLAVNDDTIYYGSLDQDGKVVSIHEYKNGEKQDIYQLPTPVLGSRILINKDGNVFYEKNYTFYDTNLNKSYPIPKDASSVFVENHKMFVLTPDKAYIMNDAEK
jgi:hypothetical protein